MHRRCSARVRLSLHASSALTCASQPTLSRALLQLGRRVLVETNGSLNIGRLPDGCVKIVDFKCPSSGEQAANDFENIGRLSCRDEVKCVIGSSEDYEFARDILDRLHRRGKNAPVVNFSPVFGTLAPRVLAEWILRDRLDVRLNLQLHKLVWDPERRGV